ncbi:MAG: proton-conducting transporter membrane subunit [Negativicutes bacterium]|nr:proton-conducting transporter membrane subunit [Negativicutes bacterium]
MNAETLYFNSLLAMCLGALFAVLFRKNDRMANYIAHCMAIVGSISAVLCAIFVFKDGGVSLSLFEWGRVGLVTARLDPLAAFFLLLVGVIGALASLYAIGYCREFYGKRLWLMAAFFNAFLLTMILVFSVSHVVAFLLAWELMTIFSFALVIHKWEDATVRRAGYIYMVMTHVGTAFIVAAFLVLATAVGSLDFEALGHANLTDPMASIVFLLALIGFGTKAGMIPVHVWLPLAHPAAPSHVSALMSGVMIKSAVYGLSRFLLEFLGVGQAWWGELILVLAIVSCVLGVLYALMENDIKKLLAYSSVENVGIIFLGMGAGVVFMAKGLPLPAALAWGAAWLHTLNHAVFKSLLFLGAGAVVQKTHTNDIEKLGGLIKKMPRTAVAFLVGSAAISALPVLNGFVSEWLTFQALFQLQRAFASIFGKVMGAVLIALLGLTGALAAGCFVKAFGITFLGKARSEKAEAAGEVSPIMSMSMLVLAALCVVIGIFPQTILPIINYVLPVYWGAETAVLFDYQSLGLVVNTGVADGVMGVPAVIGLVLLGLATAVLLSRLSGKSHEQVGDTWTCGIDPTPHMQYTATGFSKPIRTAFMSILQPERHKVVSADTNSYYGRRLEYHLSIRYFLHDKLYRPLNSGIIRGAKFIRRLQSGHLQLYIGYVLAVTVVALIWSSR